MAVVIRNRSKTEDLRTYAKLEKHTYSLDSSAPTYLDWGTKEVISIQSSDLAGKKYTADMMDWVVSDYKSRVKSGEIINNPCTKQKQWTEDCHCVREYGYYKEAPVQTVWPPDDSIPLYKKGGVYMGKVRSSHYLGDPENPLTWTLGFPTVDTSQNFIDQIVTNAFAKVDTSELSALVTIGEARETVKFLYDSGLRLLKLYRALRSLNFKAIRESMKVSEFAKRYLEYRYAVNPLVSEMDQYFRAVFVGKSYPTRKTYRHWEEQSQVVTGPLEQCYSSIYGTAYSTETASIEYLVKAGVLCAIDLEKLDRWGTKNLLQSGLDLVPLGFIADWFFNISQTLAAHLPHAGAKQLASWYSVSKIETRQKVLSNVTRNPTVTVGGVVYDHVYNTFLNCCIRSVNEEYIRKPEPMLRTFPQFKVNLDGWKLLDMGLIIKQLITIPPNRTFVKRRKLATLTVDNRSLVW